MNKDNFIRVMLREQFGWDIAIKKPDAGTYVIVPRPDSAMATQIVHGLTGQSAEWTALTDRFRFLNRWATIRFNHVAFLVVNPQVPAKYLYFVKMAAIAMWFRGLKKHRLIWRLAVMRCSG